MSTNGKGKKVPMRNLRTLVPPETFAALEMEALSADVTLAAHVRTVLVRHVSGNGIHVSPTRKMTDNEWTDLVNWYATRPEEIRPTFKNKGQALRWAQAHGYTGYTE